ncbi:MAG: hypothetical protein Q4D96_14710 [Propionibacteriaceae bacterium]|nr:hypothetical protein [Propionibacteriaceae bacterium]
MQLVPFINSCFLNLRQLPGCRENLGPGIVGDPFSAPAPGTVCAHASRDFVPAAVWQDQIRVPQQNDGHVVSFHLDQLFHHLSEHLLCPLLQTLHSRITNDLSRTLDGRFEVRRVPTTLSEAFFGDFSEADIVPADSHHHQVSIRWNIFDLV